MSAEDQPKVALEDLVDEEGVEDDNPDFPKPKYPYMAVMGHVVSKGLEAGSLMGILGGGLYLAWAKTLTPVTFSKTVGRFTFGAAVLTIGLGVARLASVDQDGVEDRAYRLRYNRLQNECDAVSYTSAVSTGLAGLALGSGPKLFRFGRWASVGFGIGVLGHTAFSTFINPKEY